MRAVNILTHGLFGETIALFTQDSFTDLTLEIKSIIFKPPSGICRIIVFFAILFDPPSQRKSKNNLSISFNKLSGVSKHEQGYISKDDAKEVIIVILPFIESLLCFHILNK